MGAENAGPVGYTPRFKEQLLRRMLEPGAISATALARETGVSQVTLSRWLKQARTLKVVKKRPDADEGPSSTPKTWSAAEKLRLIVASEGLAGEELSALLRSAGVYDSELREWREAASEAISRTTEGAPGPLSAAHRREVAALQREMKELKRELRRKEKALAEAAALLVLKKKLQVLGWDEPVQGEEDGGSDPESEK